VHTEGHNYDDTVTRNCAQNPESQHNLKEEASTLVDTQLHLWWLWAKQLAAQWVDKLAAQPAPPGPGVDDPYLVSSQFVLRWCCTERHGHGFPLRASGVSG
jgi:hypothetical protein